MGSIWQRWLSAYHALGSPRGCYGWIQRWITPLSILTLLGLLAGLALGLGFAPADALQGNSFRIIYVHVPAALVAQSGYVLMAVCGVVYWVWQLKMAAWAAQAIAPVGSAFCVIALATGAIWGKPTWGTYWVWDARLTSMLILLFLYTGVMALQHAIEHGAMRHKAAAILALLGTVNIPIIKYSVEWWNTLHQPATLTLTSKPSMHPDMLMPLLIMIAVAYAGFALLAMLRLRYLILVYEGHKRWFKNYLEQSR